MKEDISIKVDEKMEHVDQDRLDMSALVKRSEVRTFEHPASHSFQRPKFPWA